MIIGTGLLATVMMPAFSHWENSVIYAAGVSNSRCSDPKEFAREASRLEQALNEHTRANPFVYFSTCSIYDLESINTPYVLHKLAMEALVCRLPCHLIVRLPQVAGKTPNPHTLLNFLYARIARGEGFSVWTKARRNIIDCADVARIVRALVEDGWHGRVINVASDSDYSLIEIVRTFELILNKTATVEYLEQGGTYAIDTSLMASYAKNEGIRFDDEYLVRVLRKYYG